MRLLLNTDFTLIELQTKISVTGKQPMIGNRSEAYGCFWVEINGKLRPNSNPPGAQTPANAPVETPDTARERRNRSNLIDSIDAENR